MHKTITTFSILSLAHHTSRAMELVNNDFFTLLPALEVNGMALLQEKPMVEVAFVVVYTFPAMFSAVFVHCKASSHLYILGHVRSSVAHTADISKSAYTGSFAAIHCLLYYLWRKLVCPSAEHYG